MRQALHDLRAALAIEAYSTSFSLKDRDRKQRIVRMIDMKLTGRLGGVEALPDGWR